MKRMNKKIAVMLLAALMILLLTGCGLKGSYREKDGTETLIFDGKGNLTIRDSIFSITGRYKIKGDTLTLYYGDSDGYEDSEEYEYSKKGNTITLEGTEYVKYSAGRKSGAGKTILVILLIAAIGGGGYQFVKKNGIPAVRRPSKGQVQDTLYRASRTVAATAAHVGGRAAASARGVTSAVAAGVSAGVAAGKDSRREKKMIAITPYSCCMCGTSLQNGATPLGGLASGREAWICPDCLNRLQILLQTEDEEEFEDIEHILRNQAQFLDPEVSSSLLRFIKKSKVRFYPATGTETFRI